MPAGILAYWDWCGVGVEQILQHCASKQAFRGPEQRSWCQDTIGLVQQQWYPGSLEYPSMQLLPLIEDHLVIVADMRLDVLPEDVSALASLPPAIQQARILNVPISALV